MEDVAKQTLADIADKLTKFNVNRATDDAQAFFDELVKVDNPIVPEVVFKEGFLDYFFNNDFKENDSILLKWLSIAGGPYNKVDVDDESGKVLFTVPEIYNKVSVNDDMMGNIDMWDMMVKYHRKNERFVVEGDQYLINMSSQIASAVKPVAGNSEWMNIFKHYGLIKKDIKKKVEEKISIEDMFEYD